MESSASWPSTVTVPPRWLAPAPVAETQSEEPAATTACGAFPTLVVTGVPAPGAIIETDPPNWLATHSPDAVAARPVGPSPTGTVSAMVPVAGSILDTVPSRLFAAQTAFAVAT